jgi:two-component system CheB/CheR fusion protein
MTSRKKNKSKVTNVPIVVKTEDAREIAENAAELQESVGKINSSFPIVGIGASAGGLAAFEAFFSGMPADTDGFGKHPAGSGMAFVLVQHLDPDHKSILTELIRRYTRMQVFEVEDGMVVQPNCAYIIPPNCDMAFLNGTLHLMEPAAPRGQRLPIDFFFRSLAQDQHEKAICIVLSGTGSDGTQGVRAIKGEGGMAMVQSPDSAEYDGMPRSAISTGLVDYELPASEMPNQLIAYAIHAFGRPSSPATVSDPRTENALKKIFILLRTQTGHDFSQYKPSTIRRRIERRMAVNQIDKMDSYVKYLQQTPTEVEALFRDMLIGVTNFFRDPEAFKVLEEQVIPKLFVGKSASSVIRVWSPGCSTGEEAYSIAILLAERQEQIKKRFQVQIFATDIDSQAISTARAGLYSANIAADISPERLARFFTLEADGKSYRIQKGIRDMLVFSEQKVIKDPPFSKLDLISCRNLMIYMGSDLQRKLIPLFHYALNPGGALFLGTSETVGEFGDLFASLDRKSRLYQRKEYFHGMLSASLSRFIPAMTAIDVALPRRITVSAVHPHSKKIPMRELAEQALLQQVAPSAALVNASGDIFYLHGRTGMYLEPVPGEAGINNILKMAREGLRRELTAALHRVVSNREIVCRPGLRVKTNGHFTTVNLTVRPVTALPEDASSEETLYLVMLEEAPEPVISDQSPVISDQSSVISDQSSVISDQSSVVSDQSQGKSKNSSGISKPTTDANAFAIAALRQELRAKEEYLQTTNEELETSNEELKSSNEEMQSVNEELQSTNEEMETSKEELQSLNEELATVNAELQAKVSDLSRINDDMTNLLAGTGIATVFVDRKLQILRFTPAATQIVNLIPGDIGRPAGHILSNLVGYDSMVTDAQVVLDTLIPKDTEVQTKDGKWYMLRIRPYRTIDNVIEGAVISFIDITEMQKTREALRKANDLQRLSVVVRDSHDAIMVQDLEGGIMAWNPAAERIYGWSEAEALKMNIRDTITENLRDAALNKIKQLVNSDVLEPYRVKRITKAGKTIDVLLTATALLDKVGKIYAIATTEREIKGK